ncbi:eyes absent homolog isoform X3 [Phragmites australis]|uniref:eyes absent homolog isoform X3 n=1 Tax=Phragmites australis TaxID=29695 RepID=UPI002D78D22B|nr:eyes absent homolog isoform X3 [Phragmites australis]
MYPRQHCSSSTSPFSPFSDFPPIIPFPASRRGKPGLLLSKSSLVYRRRHPLLLSTAVDRVLNWLGGEIHHPDLDSFLLLLGLEKILDQHMVKVWDDLYSLTDKYTDGWLSSAHKLLGEAIGKSAAAPSANSSSINCIVTSGSLIPSLAKCLLYRLDDVVSSENVYSSWEAGKLQCFKWIKERFDGPNIRFCAIGDGPEECSAAQVMKWPFIKVEFHPEGPHRFPGLDMATIQNYMDVIYESSSKDG